MKYKRLEGIAHNFGYSFLSDMNAVRTAASPYFIVPRALVAAAARERVREVRIDFLAGMVEPESVRSPEVAEAVGHYARWLPELAASNGVDPGKIVGARLTLTFDHDRVRHARSGPPEEVPEFSCVVELTDDRGVVHRAAPDHWWRGL